MEDDLNTNEEGLEPEVEEVPEEEIEEEIDEEGESEEEEDEPEDDPEEDDEPPVRKNVKDYIIKRKDNQLSKKDEEIQRYKDKYGSLDEEEDIDDPELKKVIDKSLKPFRDKLTQETDEKELQDVLDRYPDAKGLETKIRKYMDSPAYKDVSVEFIARGLLGPKADISGKKAIANAKAKKSKTPGRNKARPKSSTGKSAWDMTDKEFEEARIKALS